jgi:trimeric autotransporter adhesin
LGIRLGIATPQARQITLTANTTGTSNSAVGKSAGFSNLSGGDLIYIGLNTGYYATGERNTFVGGESGVGVSGSSTGTNNTAIGYRSYESFTTGIHNVAVGELALKTTSSGSYNVGIGNDALRITGTQNTALGYTVLQSSTGNDNVGIGAFTLSDATSGGNNTSVGSQSSHDMTTGNNNVAVGFLALNSNTTASNNTAVGTSALTTNTTGTGNSALGKGSLSGNTTASYNTGLGENALLTNTTGASNTAVGNSALYANTTAANNTAVGTSALAANTEGSENTALGVGAGEAITTGVNNIVIGYNAGSHDINLTTGIGNIVIGNYADTTTEGSAYANVIGYNVGGEAGYTTVGKAGDDIRAAHGVATWATVSDERYKKDIVDSTTGLSFINALRPRTFKYRTLGELPETFSAYKAGSTEVFKNSETNHGFIAQEIKAAIDADASIKDGFRLWDDREDGSQEVAEAALIPVLVKAIQELTARLEALEGAN